MASPFYWVNIQCYSLVIAKKIYRIKPRSHCGKRLAEAYFSARICFFFVFIRCNLLVIRCAVNLVLLNSTLKVEQYLEKQKRAKESISGVFTPYE
ncbi:hypothetical protein KPC142_04513 [Klebsiella quasipneumoniae]|nr:hypothetical protein KPC142_04513 [Klebsiella quasipneumoniae]